MATPEQIQEIVQRMEAQQMRIAQLEGAMTEAVARGERAEQDRSTLLRLLEERHPTGATGIVDTKGVGQPFKYNGKREQDFAEWTHKMRVYLVARYGDKIIKLLQWAARQRRIVVPTNDMNSERLISWQDAFGESAPELERVAGVDQMVSQLYTYLVSFTTADANRVVRNAGEGQGLEAWRRLSNEYDPTSSMRRVTILGLVQNPPKCDKVENLGAALEEWLAKKRQYEEFTDRDGRPCKVSDDSLIAAMFKLMPKNLEETVMFKGDEYESFEALFDRLTSFASTKHSLKLEAYDRKAANPDDMDIGALGSKGKGKGKGEQRKASVQCWVCNGFGHYGRDCYYRKGGPKGDKGKHGKGGKDTGKGTKGGKDKGKKGDQKGKYGKHKKEGGKGKLNSLESGGQDDWWMNSAEAWDWNAQAWDTGDQQNQQQNTALEGEALGGLDLCAINSANPSYVVEVDGERWIKFNYDSGAATTALPAEMAEGLPLVQQGEFRVASGEVIPNMGKIKIECKDEMGSVKRVSGSVTHVKKPLLSAGEVNKRYDSFLSGDGGILVPKNSVIAKQAKAHLRDLLRWHGRRGVVPLHLENGVYNIYLKETKKPELAAVGTEVARDAEMPEHDTGARHSWEGVAGSAGGRRHA